MLTPLTNREKEVAEFLRRGYTNSEIGRKLQISTRTVESHRTNIYQKWHIHSRWELVEIMGIGITEFVDRIIVIPSEIYNNKTTTIMIGV